jgi:hypothetical protein
MAEHSPLPWEPSELASGIIDDTGKGIVICNSTDAAYIVKASNAFPDLVKALEKIDQLCRWNDEDTEFIDSIETTARAALALVKGAPDHG